MTNPPRRSVMAGLAGLAATPAFADTYPSHQNTQLVPWAPGGSTDILARIVAQHLLQSMGQPVIIENRTGASGNIGTAAVARAAPDGYTILVQSSAYAVHATLNEKPGFAALKDF